MPGFVAVEGCTLQIQPPGNSDITPQITSVASKQVKIGGKGVFFKEIKFTITGYTSITIPTWIAQKAPANGSIIATGKYAKDANGKVVLVNDQSSTVVINGTMQSGNSTVPTTESVVVKVIDAGQTYVQEK